MLDDSTFCKCIEDKLEKCEDLRKSFEDCLKHYEVVKEMLSCDNFIKFLNELLTKEECISYHHYLLYYMTSRCVTFSENFKNIINDIKKVLDNYSSDVDSILKLIDKIYESYVNLILRSIFRKNLTQYVELALICDILTRLQLYVDCLSKHNYEYCRNIMCSIRSRVYALL
ncbi:MAG: hypothetical protein GXO10_05150 [Crenarchaeota archaeon]|nr:hypothetical protein [Thermoproteota archaeon]